MALLPVLQNVSQACLHDLFKHFIEEDTFPSLEKAAMLERLEDLFENPEAVDAITSSLIDRIEKRFGIVNRSERVNVVNGMFQHTMIYECSKHEEEFSVFLVDHYVNGCQQPYQRAFPDVIPEEEQALLTWYAYEAETTFWFDQLNHSVVNTKEFVAFVVALKKMPSPTFVYHDCVKEDHSYEITFSVEGLEPVLTADFDLLDGKIRAIFMQDIDMAFLGTFFDLPTLTKFFTEEAPSRMFLLFETV